MEHGVPKIRRSSSRRKPGSILTLAFDLFVQRRRQQQNGSRLDQPAAVVKRLAGMTTVRLGGSSRDQTDARAAAPPSLPVPRRLQLEQLRIAPALRHQLLVG